MTRPRILFIEAAVTATNELVQQFEQAGYEVARAPSGDEGVQLAQSFRPGLIVVDLSVDNRVELCRRLCEEEVTRNIPLFMLTGQGSFSVSDIGAFVTRNEAPLFTRPTQSASVPRMQNVPSGRSTKARHSQILEQKGLRIDLLQHQAYTNGVRLDLTPTEFRLLECFLRQPGRAFSRRQLRDCAISQGNVVLERTIDGHVKSLRRKLNSEREMIETVRGIGYRFRGSSRLMSVE